MLRANRNAAPRHLMLQSASWKDNFDAIRIIDDRFYYGKSLGVSARERACPGIFVATNVVFILTCF